MKASADVRLKSPLPRYALAALLSFGMCGCYDVVPNADAFATTTDGAVVDTQGGDAVAPDAGPTDGGTRDTGTTDTTTTDSGTTDAGGKACTQNKDCGDFSGKGCAFYQCVSSQCVLQLKKDDTPCLHGDVCLTDTTCLAGKCQGGKNVKCECTTSADCAKKNGSNKCLGTYYCNTSEAIRVCEINPVTVPSCPKAEADGCIASWQCVPATGSCKAKLKPDFGPKAACDDGDFCTAGDHCVAGTCYAGSSPQCLCKQDADCAAKNSLCGGTYYCDTLALKPNCKLIPSTTVVCDAGKDGPCATNTCDEKSGKCAMKAAAKQLVACDDGDPCSKDDVCKNGSCESGTNTCGCKVDADCAKFDDGDRCNGLLFCDLSGKKPECRVNPATVVTCANADDDTCMSTTCDKTTGKCGKVFADLFTQCNADGNPCTVGDFCSVGGKCVAGTNTCGCATSADCTKNDSGDACLGQLFCDTSSVPPRCKINPKTVKTCPASKDVCKINLCNGKDGSCVLTSRGDKTTCNDGDACTAPDSCLNGTCNPGNDTCSCITDADCPPKAGLCGDRQFCDKSAAKFVCKTIPNSAVTCPSKTEGECFAVACDPKSGVCAAQPDSGACKDDGNPCTTELCDPATKKCVVKERGDGAVCGSGAVGGNGAVSGNAKMCANKTCVTVPKGMVLSAGGMGWFGCTNNLFGLCPAESLPATEAQVKAVFIDTYEVTVKAYQVCIDTKKCVSEPGTSGSTCNWKDKQARQDHPVNCVTWSQADEYCKAQKKRLPTEAEWERAARGGCDQALGACKAGTRIFPWGNAPPSCFWAVMQGNGGDGCGLGTTRIVGTYVKDRSPYGAQDMAGNVAEWVQDTWKTTALATWAPSDPVNVGGSTYVAKGGHLSATISGVRAFTRVEGKVGPSVGFRCALDL